MNKNKNIKYFVRYEIKRNFKFDEKQKMSLKTKPVCCSPDNEMCS